MFKYVVFALVLYKSVDAYTSVIAPEEKPPKFADQEGCYLPTYDRLLQVDVPFTPIDGSLCAKYICKDTKEIYVEGCTLQGYVCEGVTAPEFTKPYPECCERPRCP